jgi:hypothetical protein
VRRSNKARLSITGFVLRFRLFLCPGRAVDLPRSRHSSPFSSSSSADDHETRIKDDGVSALLPRYSCIHHLPSLSANLPSSTFLHLSPELLRREASYVGKYKLILKEAMVVIADVVS